MRTFALLSSQGTACAETVLTEADYTPYWRQRVEREYCRGGADDPLPGTWVDVSGNDAIAEQG